MHRCLLLLVVASSATLVSVTGALAAALHVESGATTHIFTSKASTRHLSKGVTVKVAVTRLSAHRIKVSQTLTAHARSNTNLQTDIGAVVAGAEVDIKAARHERTHQFSPGTHTAYDSTVISTPDHALSCVAIAPRDAARTRRCRATW